MDSDLNRVALQVYIFFAYGLECFEVYVVRWNFLSLLLRVTLRYITTSNNRRENWIEIRALDDDLIQDDLFL